MADLAAGTSLANDKGVPVHTADEAAGDLQLPAGWMYKSWGSGRWRTPWYASPRFQLGMVAFVCFMCPGMFNALGGLGGGGKADPKLADQMNLTLYSVFAVVGFFAGSIVNWIGIRLSLSFGGIGYCIYAISLLVSVHKHVPGFNIFAGALLGACAGILWSAQGAIMMSYPHEHQKGRYFAWFWGIFNIGACMGSLIALGTNINVKEAATVSDGTYIAFIVLMFFGACLALLLCDAKKVIRRDGSRVIVMKNPTWKTELYGLYDTLKNEPFVVLLFPMFWSSNWFYTYQGNAINVAYFNTRTRALNSFLYWFAQIAAATVIGPLLDMTYFRRSVRARGAWVILFVLTMVIWGGGWAWQKNYTRETVDVKKGFEHWDWTHSGYAGPMFLYFFYGFYDAVWQGVIYWYMGALSNSGRKGANFAGFYKGIQSAGAAVMWSIDFHNASFAAEFASNWGLLGGSLLVAAPVIWLRIKDHVDIETDLKNTDETVESVLPVGHPEKS
ncbi:conserved hypothetical protein [Aspergillus terreus NIH2624]|uniref:DUF895 domain membrane protein n=1 Tax=Aspergillus terreus (strain NIH 2624 / FGSC A1156) TaxID=341663 RepID=Q0CD20_ASPTN|nr:uncharacterized protein ATEG_08414 [Aspergillus terreus NIH2624]EAU31587.1 conserved hypothetical protein [Aspergillus terreus NIH2624]